MGIISLLWGVAAGFGMVIGMIPCLGWLNWLVIPFTFGGLVFSIVAVILSSRDNRPSGAAIAGLVICAIVGALATMRLVLGGGVM